MDKKLKIKLIIYALVSALSFTYLVLPENAGISVPIFVALQFAMVYFITPNKKKLILFIPIMIMALNCFLSADSIWKISNFAVSIILYGCMFTDISFKDDSLSFITKTIVNITDSLSHISLPFKWAFELNSEKAPVIKRIAIAVAIAVPCAVILVIVLSNADMVFSLKTDSFIEYLSDFISINAIVKCILGIAVGLFLFGILFNANDEVIELKNDVEKKNGDLIIINVLLSTILFVYTLFVAVQFKYLFAGSTLPQGLTYTEYARKGFFELLALTGVNIAIILIVTKLTKNHSGKWLTFSKILCHYLCAITIILLISSFYRMFLYTSDDGLTRLRFFVMGFLVFEAIGLIVTFVYIAKPKFNAVLIYTIIALAYYSLLNVLNVDNIIAKNQIDKYLNGERESIEYVFTLSADAIPAIEYLNERSANEDIIKQIDNFVEERTSSDIPDRWQRYNFSYERIKKFK